jgi:nitrite reductase/ring-hydroxylating ferredoxin subunit
MSAAPTRIELCRTDEVSPGETRKIETAGLTLAVYNVDGAFFVTDDACTHGPGSLSEGFLEDDVIECNFHQGKFNVRTGDVVLPPCMIPVKTYRTTVDHGVLFIEV